MSQLKNDFPIEVRNLFLWNFECWVCGKNTWDCGHHIMGRGFGDSIVEQSALNFAPLCNYTCHLGRNFTEEEKKIMLQKTIRFLLRNNYQLKEIDIQFYEKYKRYYQ